MFIRRKCLHLLIFLSSFILQDNLSFYHVPSTALGSGGTTTTTTKTILAFTEFAFIPGGGDRLK